MRAPGRAEMPDLSQLLEETNSLLSRHSLPLCNSVEPVADQDTMNPVVIGHAGHRQYAVKVSVRYSRSLQRQLVTANVIADRSGLPIPRHLCCSQSGDALALMVMEMMPGEQLRVLLQRTSLDEEQTLAEDLGRCLGRFHQTRIQPSEIPGWPDPADTVAAFFNWLRQENAAAFRRLEQFKHGAAQVVSADEEQLTRWLGEKARDIQAYVSSRMPHSIFEPVRFGLTEVFDLRDTLGLLTPAPRISALLDWEQVNHGEQMWGLLWLFGRFHMIGKPHLWTSLRKGYEEIADIPLKPHRLCDLYAMTIALIPVSRSDVPERQSVAIIRGLLEGTLAPLAD